MSTYAVTGSASGMGAEVVTRLRAAEHTVVTVDRRDADVAADPILSWLRQIRR